MQKIKFIHTADLHLDTPFKGLTLWNPGLAARLKDATYRSFRNIIDLCISEKVDFLLIAGDIFDSENMSLAAQIRFSGELKRLSDKCIPTYFICGNHDNLESWDKSFGLPPYVYRFGSSDIEIITFSRNGEVIADIYGISYQSSYITENISLKYRRSANPAPISIAMLHGMADIVGKDDRFAPFSLKDLDKKSFDYWALGHVHKGRVLNENPPVVYPGNPQGRDFGETGQKGCYLVEISAGHKQIMQFVPVQNLRFEEVVIDLTGQDNVSIMGMLVDQAKEELIASDSNTSFILRIRLTGRTKLHSHLSKPGELEQIISMMNEGQLEQEYFTWLDSIENLTCHPADIGQLKLGQDFIAEIIKNIEGYEKNDKLLSSLMDQFYNELPGARILREIDGFSEIHKKQILEKAKWMLIDRLIDNTDNDTRM